MKNQNFYKLKYPLLIALFLTVIISSCSDNTIENGALQTDDEYIRNIAMNSSFSSNEDDDDNLFYSDEMDFESEGATYSNANNNTPLDSILKWGRRITGKNVNVNITTHGDTLKDVIVTKAISGNFIIIGYTGGILDSAVKPFSQEHKRLISFKRVDRRQHPRHNWRVFQYSAVDGETKTPQIGKENITMNRVEYYRNNELILTLNGPDFTTNIFSARHFGNQSQIELVRGDQVKIKVFLSSNQIDEDIVAYHWGRNSHGFHRELFEMTTEIQNGNNFDRTFEKTFEIYQNHKHGMHNGFISSITRSSLFDNSTSLFSSTYMGLPYRVRH
ncbi:MAG TPA: hypothetical protein PLD63_06660 [Ignavibacteria bacterium]|nr:hypothetical protein [Ignavibacteria bacterium]